MQEHKPEKAIEVSFIDYGIQRPKWLPNRDKEFKRGQTPSHRRHVDASRFKRCRYYKFPWHLISGDESFFCAGWKASEFSRFKKTSENIGRFLIRADVVDGVKGVRVWRMDKHETTDISSNAV